MKQISLRFTIKKKKKLVAVEINPDATYFSFNRLTPILRLTVQWNFAQKSNKHLKFESKVK